jgi:hypothetical protein
MNSSGKRGITQIDLQKMSFIQGEIADIANKII